MASKAVIRFVRRQGVELLEEALDLHLDYVHDMFEEDDEYDDTYEGVKINERSSEYYDNYMMKLCGI